MTELFNQKFDLKSLPTSKHEDWRYTPLSFLTAIEWKINDIPEIIITDNNKNKAAEIIITDMISAQQKYPEYIKKYDLDSSFRWSGGGCGNNGETVSSCGFMDLNAALFSQGFFIVIPQNTQLEQPIEIIYPELPDEQMACFRNVIILEEGAEATIIETFSNSTSHRYFSNTLTQAHVHANAKLTHYKQHNESKNSFHLSKLIIKQQENSHAESHVVSTQGGWIRSDTHIQLEAPHAHCVFNGITLGQDKQYVDHHTTVEHLTPHGTSDEYYKSILKDNAHGVFNGKVIVSKKAIQTSAAQKHKTLLLSRSAQIHTKPQLEIFSDDVKCTHGATVGQLDEEALFYLETRGIDKATAQQLLIKAFLGDVIERMPEPSIQANLQKRLTEYYQV